MACNAKASVPSPCPPPPNPNDFGALPQTGERLGWKSFHLRGSQLTGESGFRPASTTGQRVETTGSRADSACFLFSKTLSAFWLLYSRVVEAKTA